MQPTDLGPILHSYHPPRGTGLLKIQTAESDQYSVGTDKRFSIEEVCKHLEISEASWHRRQGQYGGMESDDAKRLRELEQENARLKKMVAEQALDIDMLKEVNRGNF